MPLDSPAYRLGEHQGPSSFRPPKLITTLGTFGQALQCPRSHSSVTGDTRPCFGKFGYFRELGDQPRYRQ